MAKTWLEKNKQKSEQGEELIKKILEDVREIQKVVKIKKPKKIKIFVSPKWKYDVYKKMRKKEKNCGN